MTAPLYRVIHKEPLVIYSALSIPVPYSHPIEGKAAAMEWMMGRGLSKECKVICEAQFRALNGWCAPNGR